MSWRATAYVKELREAPNGQRLTCGEKLVMFVLADCYNEDYRRAWPSVQTLADAALMTKRNVRRILRSLEGKGLLETAESRGIGHSNSYRFPGHSGEVTKIKTDNLSGLSLSNNGRGESQNRTPERGKADVAPSAEPKGTGTQRVKEDEKDDRLYRQELEHMQRPGPIGEATRRHWRNRLSDPTEAFPLPDWFRRQAKAMLGK